MILTTFYSSIELQSDLDGVAVSFLLHIKEQGYAIISDINVKNP
jgi:hypothetical protein